MMGSKFTHLYADVIFQESRIYQIVPIVDTIDKCFGSSYYSRIKSFRRSSSYHSSSSGSGVENIQRRFTDQIQKFQNMNPDQKENIYHQKIKQEYDRKIQKLFLTAFQKKKPHRNPHIHLKQFLNHLFPQTTLYSKRITDTKKDLRALQHTYQGIPSFFQNCLKNKNNLEKIEQNIKNINCYQSVKYILLQIQGALSNINSFCEIIKVAFRQHRKSLLCLLFSTFPHIAFKLHQNGEQGRYMFEEQELLVNKNSLDLASSFKLALIELQIKINGYSQDHFSKSFHKAFLLRKESMKIISFLDEQIKYFINYQTQYAINILQKLPYEIPQFFIYQIYAIVAMIHCKKMSRQEDELIYKFFQLSMEKHQFPGLIEILWKVYWMIFPIFTAQQFLRHVEKSVEFLSLSYKVCFLQSNVLSEDEN